MSDESSDLVMVEHLTCGMRTNMPTAASRGDTIPCAGCGLIAPASEFIVNARDFVAPIKADEE